MNWFINEFGSDSDEILGWFFEGVDILIKF